MASRYPDKVPEKVQDAIFNELLNKPENRECADCNNKNPTWVSIDFGVFVCLRCSGLHRQLGPTITRVRSCKLDYSFKMEQIEIIMNIGNKLANEFYESNLQNYSRKPSMNASMDEVWKYVNDKYVKKIYALQNEKSPVQKYHENKSNKGNQNSEPARPVRQEPSKNATSSTQYQEPKRKEVSVSKPVIVDLLCGDDSDSVAEFKTAESFSSNNGNNNSPKNDYTASLQPSRVQTSVSKAQPNFGVTDLMELSFSSNSKSSSVEIDFSTPKVDVTVAPQPQQQPQVQPLQEVKTNILSLYSTPQAGSNSYDQKSNFQQSNGFGYNAYSNGNYGNSYGMTNPSNGYANSQYPNNGYMQNNGVNYGNNAYNPMGYNMNYGYGNPNPYMNTNAPNQSTQGYGVKAPNPQDPKNVDITALYGRGNFF
jgi:stromal membrane-associated protein